jgi:hypothetical protein
MERWKTLENAMVQGNDNNTRAVYLPPASAQKTLASAWDWFEGQVDGKKRDMLTFWLMRALADAQAWSPLATFGGDEQPIEGV